MEPKSVKRPALGKGLGALIPGGSPAERKGILILGIEEITPDRGQPRRHFPDETIAELAASIKEKGVLSPILVRRDPAGAGYLLIAGERRWRAAQRAGLRELPALVREVSEGEAFELALIENIQREDLNPVEVAEAYRRLLDEHSWTQEELATRLGKDRATIANTLRLLRLPEAIKSAMVSGKLSMGHARALLGLAEPAELERIAASVMAEGLSVRAIEQLVQRVKGKRQSKKEAVEVTPHIRSVVERVQRRLGTKVELKDRAGKGELVLRYDGYGDLDRILALVLGE